MRVTRNSLNRTFVTGLVARVELSEPWTLRDENNARKLEWIRDVTGISVMPAESIDDLHHHLLFDNRTFVTARSGADGGENEIVATASIDTFVAVHRRRGPLFGNCVTYYWFGSEELAARFEAQFKESVARPSAPVKTRFLVRLNRASLQTYSRNGTLNRVKLVGSLQDADQRFVRQSEWIYANTGSAVISPEMTGRTERYMVIADRALITISPDTDESLTTGFDTFVAAYRRTIALHGNSVTYFWFGNKELAAQFEAKFCCLLAA